MNTLEPKRADSLDRISVSGALRQTNHGIIQEEVERLVDELPSFGTVGFELVVHERRITGIRRTRTESIKAESGT